jgi:hyperosmotically inducible protein
MHRSKPHTIWVCCCITAMAVSASLNAQPQTTPASSTSTSSSPVDNTQMNRRDRDNQTVTPAHQPNDKADIKLAAAVRRAIVKDKSLSTTAHNIKIVASQGAVTLRGPVKSEEEKARVETTVKSVAGVNSVDNELDVKH